MTISTDNKSKFTIAWLLSYISIASVSAAIITPALPNIQVAFSLSLGTVEWMISAFLIGYVVGQLIYGPLANTYGRLTALKWGLNLNLVGLLLCLVAGYFYHYPLLVIGRLITGLGSAAGLTCTFILINEWLPESQRKMATSYSILSFALGVGFAVLLGSMITQYIQWQGCFIFLIIQSIVMRFGIRVFSETLIQPKPIHIHTLITDYWNALHSFKLLVFSLIWGTCTTVGYCYSASAPQIAHEYLHLTVSEYGFWNMMNIMGMLIGGITARILMHRLSVFRVIGIGYLGSSLALANLIWMYQLESQSVLWFFSSSCLLFCASAYLFAGGSYIASNAISDKASASSMMSFINMSVATLSVIAMGYISANPFTGFLLTLAIVFSITFSLLLLFQMKFRVEHLPATK